MKAQKQNLISSHAKIEPKQQSHDGNRGFALSLHRQIQDNTWSVPVQEPIPITPASSSSEPSREGKPPRTWEEAIAAGLITGGRGEALVAPDLIGWGRGV